MTTQPLLKLALEPVVKRHRAFRRLRLATNIWAITALLAVARLAASKNISLLELCVLLGGLIFGLFCAFRQSAWEPDYRLIARQVGERHPELHALLITAVEQQPNPTTGRLHFLQGRVVDEAVAMSRRHRWIDTISAWHWLGAWTLNLVVLAALAVIGIVICAPAASGTRHHAGSALANVVVTPGDAAIERGAALVITARFRGEVPGAATLVLQPRNAPEQRVPLMKNLDDPVFGGALPEVDADLSYRVEYAGGATRDFCVSVFEHPRLERADARLRFPEYTRLPEREVADTRRLSAVEGTRIDVAFALNKPVKSARLVGKDGSVIPLETEAGKPLATLKNFPLAASQTYELKLEDSDGRANKIAAQLHLDAAPNRRPELKLTAPRGDQRVSPLQEILFAAEAWDDFGLGAWGLGYTIAGGEVKEVVLGRDTAAGQRVQGSHLLKLEELGVKADELLSWFAWAEDTGPDGKTRRTATDIFFAEVRPFEEIYRPGPPGGGEPPPGQSGTGNQATKLAELQKQIVAATWKMQRSEAGATPSAAYQKDEPVVRDSQAEALKQAEAMREKIEEPRSQALAEAVTREMKNAVDRLTEATTSLALLPLALRAEQSAYGALLKLAAHEFQVSRSRGGGQEKGGGQRQPQLDQMELKEEKNRYETKREAAPAQNEQQREQLAILNRLKELAQRQGDINERLKELQTALQEAKTEAQREDLRRQLKRLREEEQALVADLDEARQKMEQAPNQAALAEERKRLDATRNAAQQAGEAMERKEGAGQALAAGTRAERELQQLRDDFRKKTAGQFSEEMRRMRTDARELAETEAELGKKLEAAAAPKGRERASLDPSGPREELAREFEKQTARLGGLREAMRRVSEQADGAEPLLAKELYDTLRRNSQANTDESLQRAGQLAERGFSPLAQKLEAKARGEVEELKNGVERAAESVLGNEEEALRLARAELDALAGQIEREIAQAAPSALSAAGKVGEKPGDAAEGNPSQAALEQAPDGRSALAGAQPGEQKGAGEKGEAGRNGGAVARGKPGGEGAPKPSGSGENAGDAGAPGEGRPKSGEAGNSQKPGAEKGGGMANGPDGGKPGKEGATPGGKGAGGATGGGDGKMPDAEKDASKPGAKLREMAAAGPRGKGGIRSGAGGEGGGEQGGGIDQAEGPLRGGNFVQWSDRLRNVEEMIDAPALRTEAARIRELARGVRAEFKRHSQEPQWEMVRTQISAPLAELRDRLSEELARRGSKESLVPIDRDPVPSKYAEGVRKYYEELGRSR